MRSAGYTRSGILLSVTVRVHLRLNGLCLSRCYHADGSDRDLVVIIYAVIRRSLAEIGWGLRFVWGQNATGTNTETYTHRLVDTTPDQPPSPPNPRVTTPRVILSGESRYRFDTRPYIPVEAAQAAVAALRFQQRCPYSPLA